MDNIADLYRMIADSHFATGHLYLRLADALGRYSDVQPDNAPIAEPVTEMAVHAPTEPCAPPDESSPVHVAEFAPDAVPTTDTSEPIAETIVHTGAHETADAVPTGRSKNEYTAAQWGSSTHFLTYMKKPPFNAWTAEEQNAKRDAFIAAIPPDLTMNRWGPRFSKFCGVKVES